ncbi:MAG TPA: M15 family metallopeptidase [Clostridiales bacterium]|nr:M15 family metallopeptidase [Clostridiales bacterium]
MRRRSVGTARILMLKRRSFKQRRRSEIVFFLLLVIFITVLLNLDYNPKEKGIDDIPRGRNESVKKNHGWNLVLVNSKNPLPSNYSVNLETVQNNHQVDSRIAEYVRNMINDAEHDGVQLLICSSYRSVARQQELFDQQVDKYISAGKSYDEALAETVFGLAMPGHSEHNTGLALDIVTPDYQILDSGFENTKAFEWLDKNAHKYGFILRYPKDKTDITGIKYEPWHYRYVGSEHAAAIKEKGFCLEEYLEQLQ